MIDPTPAPTMALSRASMHKIRVHAMEAYPEECCGILLGTERDAGKEVYDVIRIGNAREENRTRRFLIAPEEYRRARRDGVLPFPPRSPGTAIAV